MNTTRRAALRGAAAAGLATLALPSISRAAAGSVVVIGAGFGGATAARYLKMASPQLDVTLIDRETRILTCPFSNGVLAGYNTMADITRSLDGVRAAGVKIVTGEAAAIDTAARSVRMADGTRLAYDRLVVSPGIDFNYEGLPGYSAAAAEILPHAWKAGPQTLLLKSQLEAMPDGGTFIVVAPANPFRCPPGPYERISLVASYFKARKPKSKILVLDAKDAFSKQGLFQQAWESEFPGMVTWIAAKDGGKAEKVDPQARTVTSGFGTEKGDVINVIPPQRAGAIAASAGLTAENGWCPVDPMTFASTKAQNVYVVGDASVAGAMPKSGSSANAQAKVAVAAIVASLDGKPAPAPALFNICYSLVHPTYGISVADVYNATPDKGIVPAPNAGGVSVRNATGGERQLEALYAVSWYKSISADTWG
ncbi:MAG TPA: NAD(P)/FAD-dependent oxidoreductase [Reyranella sp.]|nr:NAD(P)/FAD-dependent oxidoreductase [Reyranella sp.]